MGHERLKPYIGITGVPKDISVANELSATIRTYDLSAHQWMVGYLATERTLLKRDSNHPIYPSLSELPDLLDQTNESAFNTVHYSTKTLNTISEQVHVLFTQTGIYENNLCRGLQLNTHWPAFEEVAKIRDDFPEMVLALQIGNKALQETDEQIVDRVGEYQDTINCLLIDPSMGKGEPMDITRAASLYMQLKEEYPEISIVFAGGIAPENVVEIVEEIESLIGSKNFGIDAQSGLLNKARNVFDVNEAKRYVENAARVFNKTG